MTLALVSDEEFANTRFSFEVSDLAIQTALRKCNLLGNL